MNSNSISTFVIFTFIFFLKLNAIAQAPDWLWVKAIGGIYQENCYAVTTDSDGNLYLTGNFKGTVDFDPSPGTFYLTVGAYNAYVLKLDSTGNFLWAKAFDGLVGSLGVSITLDASGNIYTCGNFYGIVDFDPDSGIYNLEAQIGTNVFISKLSSNGDFIFAKSVSGPGTSEAFAIKVDKFENVYTTGVFNTNSDFDPDTTINYILTSNSSDDIFILKLNSIGNFQWAKRIGGSNNEYVSALDIDSSGNIYTTGSFIGNVDFDPDSIGTFDLTSIQGSLFINKVDNSGNFVWAKSFPGIGFGFGLALDPAWNIYATGYFNGTTDFDPDSTGIYNLTSFGDEDIFILKLKNSGEFIWAKSIGDTALDFAFSLITNDFGDVFLAGTFSGTVDFSPDSAVTNNLTSIGNTDLFVMKLDSSGSYQWAKQVGGLNDDDVIGGLARDQTNNLIFTGFFESSLLTFGNINITNIGNYDIFISKINHIPTGINEIPIANSVVVYPNPANEYLTILINNSNMSEINIKGISGESLFSEKLTGTNKLVLNISDYKPGVYIIQIISQNNTETKKIIILK